MAKRKSSALLSLGIWLSVVQGSALAQSAAVVGALEEITVTATRQSASIQNVPLSVSAYDQNAITQSGISDIEDITRLTPGLDATTGYTGNTVISIRGIYSQVGTATTGIYIDDTPIQVRSLGAGVAAGSAFPSMFDLERIEILRGPQGTLFGSGSEGGTVRFITPQPSLSQWSGHARSEFAFSENGVPSTQFGVAGGGPLAENKLGFRASAYIQNDAGWVDRAPFPSTFNAETNANSESTQALSVALAWAVTSNLTLTPSVFYQRQRVDDQSLYFTDLSNPSAHKFVAGSLVAQPTTDRFVLPSLKAQWDLDGVSLYSNTSYLDRTRDATNDYSFYITELLTGDYTGPSTPAPVYFNNPQRQFTQEIRVQSTDPASRLHWVAGAFYQRVDQKADEIVVAPGLVDVTQALFGASVADVFGSDALPGGIVYSGHDTSHDTQVAGYGQVDFRLSDSLTATAGIRVAHSKFDYRNAQDGPFNGGPSGSSGGGSENDNTPKVGLSYKPIPDLMFYGSAAKGFRPGGANTPVSAALCGPDLAALGLTGAPSTYASDHVWSYEIGSKGAALEHRFQWDASAFYVNWSNIESSVALSSCGFQFIGNLGKAVSKGFDLQFSALVLRGLTVGTALGYTDANYSQTVAGAGTNPIVTKGERLQSAPWHIAVSLDYDFMPFENGASPYVHIDAQYTNAYQTGNPSDALFNPVTAQFASTTFAFARGGVKIHAWDVSAFAKNLFNSRSVLVTDQDLPGSSLIERRTFAPRTVGITATYLF